MEKLIQTHLNHLQEQHNIKVVFACEAGSRAWGVPSVNSDYNIRVIYIHPIEWYLSVNEKKDNILIDNQSGMDIQAWDFKKTLSLLSQSNTTLFEWLHSPVVYKKCPAFFEQITALAKNYFQVRKSIYHYLGLSNTLIKKHFERDSISVKKYFIIVRSILAALWVKTHQSPVPATFTDLLPLLENQPKYLLAIHKLMRLKCESKDGKMIARLPSIDECVFEYRKTCSVYAESLPKKDSNDFQIIDSFFRDFLKEK